MIAKPKVASVLDCPEPERHTNCPSGYVAWFDWAERMGKTHRQVRCTACGFLAVWVLKKKPSDA